MINMSTPMITRVVLSHSGMDIVCPVMSPRAGCPLRDRGCLDIDHEGGQGQPGYPSRVVVRVARPRPGLPADYPSRRRPPLPDVRTEEPDTDGRLRLAVSFQDPRHAEW